MEFMIFQTRMVHNTVLDFIATLYSFISLLYIL